MSESHGPLAGIRVIDLSSFLSGPFSTMMLGDLGADVIKVERPPKGDPLRTVGHRYRGQSVQCVNVNRNKRSILLDLRVAEDRQVVLDLAVEADVLVQNWRPGVATALGLDDRALASANPRLIRLSITGYGPDGPYADRPAFDSLIQAQTGTTARHRVGDRPATIPNYVADKVTSLMAAQAVLAALVERDRTGVGRRVEVSMLDALAYFNFPDIMEDQTFLGDPAGRQSRPLPRSFIVAASDGYLAVAPATGAQVRQAMCAVGHPEWVSELRSIQDPLELLRELLDRIESVTAGESVSTWLRRFTAEDVPVAPVLDARGHLEDVQVAHNRLYSVYTHRELGPMRAPRYPALFDGAASATLRLHAPAPGEHDEAIRRSLFGGQPSDQHGEVRSPQHTLVAVDDAASD